MAEWTRYRIIIAVVIVISGSADMLLLSLADASWSRGRDGVVTQFHHPFVQAWILALGEAACWVVFKILHRIAYLRGRRTGNPQDEGFGNQNFNPLLLLPPAVLDTILTSLNVLALTMTHVSNIQMLRTAVIIFTFLLSEAFLGNRYKWHITLGVVVTTCGLLLFGFADVMFVPHEDVRDRNAIITGNFLALMSTIFRAMQNVYEQKVLRENNIHPLQAVGWEGIFGFTLLGVLLVPLYYIPTGAFFRNGRVEDTPDAFVQIIGNWKILLATIGLLPTVAVFNFSAISITKDISALTSTLIESSRIIVIWIPSILLHWQPVEYKFIITQVAGLLLFVSGIYLYSRKEPHCCRRREGNIEQNGNRGDGGDEGAAERLLGSPVDPDEAAGDDAEGPIVRPGRKALF